MELEGEERRRCAKERVQKVRQDGVSRSLTCFCYHPTTFETATSATSLVDETISIPEASFDVN